MDYLNIPEGEMGDLYRKLKAKQYEENFLTFFQDAWHTVEPSTILKWGWAMEAIGTHVQALMDGSLGKQNLLINCPPGISKSMFASVMLPAWCWTWDPSMRIIGASYATRLSMRDAMKGRDVIASEWYQEFWGDTFQIKQGKDSQQYYENTSTGWRYATSSTAALTGFRGDLIIVDDPHSAASAESEAERASELRWFSETLPTRVNDPNTVKKIVIMQRLHEEDISGFILEHLSDEWEHLMLPMRFEPERRCKTSIGFVDPRKEDGELLFPERYPEAYVDSVEAQFRAESGDYAVAGQHQQRPVSREGGMFKVEDVKYIQPDDPRLDTIYLDVRGWDLAATEGKKADYTAGVRIGKMRAGGYVIMDVVRGKWEPGPLETMLLSVVMQDGGGLMQCFPRDPGAAGKTSDARLKAVLKGFPVKSSLESGSKYVRAVPLAAVAAHGELYILADQPWTKDFVAELVTFSPTCRNDDQVDAASRGFMELNALDRIQVSTETPRYFEDQSNPVFE